MAKGEADIAFNEFPQEGVKQDYTYHVDRQKFDLLMLKHAESLGTKVYQGIGASKVSSTIRTMRAPSVVLPRGRQGKLMFPREWSSMPPDVIPFWADS